MKQITLQHGFFSEANAPLDGMLQFLIQSKSLLLTVTRLQVCFRVDSWGSDMDHRQTQPAGLEQLEHLVRFQKLICVDCLLPFQKIKRTTNTGTIFAP